MVNSKISCITEELEDASNLIRDFINGTEFPSIVLGSQTQLRKGAKRTISFIEITLEDGEAVRIEVYPITKPKDEAQSIDNTIVEGNDSCLI